MELGESEAAFDGPVADAGVLDADEGEGFDGADEHAAAVRHVVFADLPGDVADVEDRVCGGECGEDEEAAGDDERYPVSDEDGDDDADRHDDAGEECVAEEGDAEEGGVEGDELVVVELGDAGEVERRVGELHAPIIAG